MKRHGGKYIVIVGEKVVGVFDSDMEAYLQTKKTHDVGTFLIQHCLPGKNSYTQTFSLQKKVCVTQELMCQEVGSRVTHRCARPGAALRQVPLGSRSAVGAVLCSPCG